jgi:VWFA-related protein
LQHILLFDLANTPQEDQLEARKQLVKFLQALPSGQQVALFALTGRLQMIQNFTGNSDRLREAARQLNPRDYGLILSKAAAMEGEDVAAEFALQSGGGGAMQSQIDSNNRADSTTRANITVAALGTLARATSGYPGRKNLLWLSESFPIALGAQLDETKYLGKSSVPGARETANLMAAAQIAVYPISLLGLEGEGVGPAASGISAVIPGGGNSATISNQFNGRQALKATMNDLADQTGGEAFAGTNDFADALRRSMDDGSNYYTLAYRPHNQKWNGQFRKIRVELATRGDSLSYRRGYFAYPDSTSSTDGKQELASALRPGTPESTMLLLRSKIELPGTQNPEVHIDSALDPGNISFITDGAGHRHAQLLVLLVAFDDSLKKVDTETAPPPQTSGVLTLDLNPEQYEAVANKGIAFHQQLRLPPGRYRLRLGVSDLGNHRIGTLDMAIDIATATVAK